MLHLDKNTKAYLDALDANFQTTPKMSEGLENEIQKTFSNVEYQWEQHYNRIQTGVKSWHNKLVTALSTPIPARYVGNQRPVNRLFPYMSKKADLVDSVGTPNVILNKNAGFNTWQTSVEIGADHVNVTKTNDGWNSSKRNVHWFGWADDVFGNPGIGLSTKRRGHVPDIRDVLLGYYG